jgi:hypothetical protein
LGPLEAFTKLAPGVEAVIEKLYAWKRQITPAAK